MTRKEVFPDTHKQNFQKWLTTISVARQRERERGRNVKRVRRGVPPPMEAPTKWNCGQPSLYSNSANCEVYTPTP